MPRGTHLLLRFFINDVKSAVRECYWSGSTHICHIWAPPAKVPPPEALDGQFKVGVEIIKNFSAPPPGAVKVPVLREAFSAASQLVVGQRSPQKSKSLPNL
eukprot:gnl/MRDRNA2_/MRDRNA2_360558_c0_seq1.p1 gnl/MRDRNA2_/MRDRNA2_360558_c0~~gnl/MRDRNA2_/MRDRNA2_360558_c0_seq1.p1  ORF type:complete len:101 (-),score=19.22 gnl/MRDRNA2_/MRDRNA2_360558_c0_seq1:64-366(-)